MTAPIWLDLRDALTLHDRLLALHGGATGIRDQGLLESALARPLQLHASGNRPDIPALAGAYAMGLLKNHPFIDGNKRTGFLLGILFLELNGYRFHASEEDATQMVFAAAAGSVSEKSFTAWLRKNSSPFRTHPRR